MLGCLPALSCTLTAPGHEKHVTHACFSCSAALLPQPSSQPENCAHKGTSPAAQHTERAHMGMFFVLSCLPALSSTLTTPRTQKICDTHVFFVFSSSPAPPLVPCIPTQRTCPCGHILCAWLPPCPHLPSHHPQDTKNARRVACFSCSAASLPPPALSLQPLYCTLTRNTHPLRRMFRGRLPPHPPTNMKTCPSGHIFVLACLATFENS